MQIHELNNFSGNSESGYLAMDDGNDTGKISGGNFLSGVKSDITSLGNTLNARIDNIIAGGTAPSAAEVTDARLGADGVTYPSLGAAIRGQVGDLLKGFKALSSAPFSIDNEYISASGNVVANNDYHRTDFIGISAGQAVGIIDAYAGGSSLAITFYTSSKTFISGVNNVNGTVVVQASSVPNNAAYVIFGSAKTFAGQSYDSIALISAEDVTSEINQLQTDISKNENALTGLKTDFDESGYYAVNGTTQTNNDYKRTGLIPFTDKDRFELIGFKNGSSSLGYAFFDSQKAFISGGNNIDGDVSSDDVTIPANTAFVAFSTWTAVVPNAHMFVSNAHGVAREIELKGSPLLDTQILIFGDSITVCCALTINSSNETTSYSWLNPSNSYVDAGGTTVNYSMWAKILRDSEECEEIRNYAYSGASYKTAARTPGNERQNLQYQIDVAMNDLNNPNGAFVVNNFDPDIVIFALGTNDGVPNDTYNDAMNKTVYEADGVSIDVDATIAALDDTKFCESARKAYMRVKKAFPMAQLFCVMPIQRANGDANLGALHENLEMIAKRYGCIIIDGAYDTGITRDFNIWNDLGEYLKDGLHPNEKGQNLLARAIISSLKRNYMPFGPGFNA